MDSHASVVEQAHNLDTGRTLEWLVANGRGGYATGTVCQLLSRRYHGLLVAAVNPPVERFVLLAKLDATVIIDGLTYELATNDYPEAVHPQGYKSLESFTASPFPRWRWRVGDCVIEQSLCMREGEDTTFVQYRLVQGSRDVQLVVRPLSTSRYAHHLARRGDLEAASVQETEAGLHLSFGANRPEWQLSHNGKFKHRPDWYYQFVLLVEAQRGYDSMQDLWTPGTITSTLRVGDETALVIAASTQSRSWRDASESFDALALKSHAASSISDPLAEELIRSGEAFVVTHGTRNTVIAGYPWFGDWGRDTFISLPGLCLVPGRFEQARNILESFAAYVNRGMIPNRFPDYGEAPAYDTVDATLWYVHAIDRYCTYSGDWEFVKQSMLPVIAEIIDAHEKGTRHGIGMTPDGLLVSGEPGVALTWMDAKIGDRAITPRRGKAVEICALWYNALCIAADFAKRAGQKDRAGQWRDLADKAFAAFNEKFWHATADCLYDVVDCDGHDGANDATVRPNQLLAISLTHPVLERGRWASVVSVCERHLWTPMGMRTLSPCDPAYHARYGGDQTTRDEAYHQGTVWPWLLGPFVTAFVRSASDPAATRIAAQRFVAGLASHLQQAGLGGVSEVADGQPPHQPNGCPWQAWSVAEPLRAICEDILQTHPSLHSGSAPVDKPVARTAVARR